MADDWWESERDLHSWRRELDRLKRRARARLFRTLFLTGLATAVLVWKAAQRVPLAESSILIRVTEGGVMWEDSPTSSRNLAAFLSDTAHSNQNLMKVIEKHDLYPIERLRGEMYALVELRMHLDVQVYRNYFMQQRGYSDSLRTARIALTFSDDDPAVSIAVARDLAQLIIDSETRRREENSREVANVAQLALDSAVTQLVARHKELATKQNALADSSRRGKAEDIATLQVEISRLTKELDQQATVAREARAGKSRADLRYALDSGRMNLLYEIVDERAPPPAAAGKEFRLAIIGLACFLILLPLCAVAIGAFDSRIHDLEDVQRLGLEVVGQVPRFAGFGVGSLEARRTAEDRRT